jgi:orotate phosphoribosyltransferase
MDTNQLKQRYVNGVYETKSLLIHQEPFELKSGGRSHIYLNHNNFLTRGEYLKVVAELYLASIPQTPNRYKLGVVDSIMSPIIVGAMSAQAGLDVVVIKARKQTHGVKDDVFGDASGEIILIDDMTSTGSTISDAAKKIRAHGGVVKGAIVSASRNQKARENLLKEEIELTSIFTFDQIIELLNPRLGSRELDLIQADRKLRS